MYQEILNNKIYQINELKSKNKAIISLGCSFVQGQGAFDESFAEKYKDITTIMGNRMVHVVPKNEVFKYKEEMLAGWESLRSVPTKNLDEIPIDYSIMENENSFVEVLCREYLTDYIAFNFGMKGNGNRATINQLFRFPEIDFSRFDDIIVLWFPAGLERFDFAQKATGVSDHFTHITMWPQWNSKTGSVKDLWKGYAYEIYDDYFTMCEYLDLTSILQLWCKAHNAKLYIYPAYHTEIEKEKFLKIALEPRHTGVKTRVVSRIKNYPWDKHINFEGCKTIAEFVNFLEMDKSDGYNKNSGYWHYFNVGSPNLYWTKCAHPSAKSHRMIAKYLAEILRND